MAGCTWGPPRSAVLREGSVTVISRGKKRFHVVILARVASATHKPLIATAKRKLADMELAEITDHRFRGSNVIFRWIVKLGESGWQADKAVVQQSPKADTSRSTLT